MRARARVACLTSRACSACLAAAIAVACANDGERGERGLLPAVTAAGTIPTGIPAGVAGRGAGRATNPYAGDGEAIRTGERLYLQMNCVECHGYQGQGQMCPSLADGEWLFGGSPSDVFISIHGGRARGMPAYGHLLPESSIWMLVAYVDELGRRAGQPGRAGGEPAEAATQAGVQKQGGGAR